MLAPATSKMTNRGGGKGYTLTTRDLRAPQPAALHVLPAFEFGDIQNREYIWNIYRARVKILLLYSL